MSDPAKNITHIRPGSTPNALVLRPKSMDEAMSMATMLSSSALVPAMYKSKPEDTLVAMMMGEELGLNPIQALQNIAVINGKPSVYGDALLALVQNHPAYGGVEEVFDDNSFTAICTSWRKDSEIKHSQSFSKADAVKAGLWDERPKVTSYKNGQPKEIRNPSPWFNYPKRMLQMRARGFSLRDTFADALAGLITVEEAADYVHTRQEYDVTPAAETQNDRMTDSQMKELKSAMEFAGVDEAYICGKANVEDIWEIHPDRFQGCIAHLRQVAQRRSITNDNS